MKYQNMIRLSIEMQEIASYLQEFSEKTIKAIDRMSYTIEMKETNNDKPVQEI